MFLTDIMLLAFEEDPKITKEENNAKKTKNLWCLQQGQKLTMQDLEQNDKNALDYL